RGEAEAPVEGLANAGHGIAPIKDCRNYVAMLQNCTSRGCDLVVTDRRRRSGGVAHLVIAGLTWRQRREGASLGLQVEERRPVEAVEPAHENVGALDAHERGDLRADRVRAGWAPETEGTARRA